VVRADSAYQCQVGSFILPQPPTNYKGFVMTRLNLFLLVCILTCIAGCVCVLVFGSEPVPHFVPIPHFVPVPKFIEIPVTAEVKREPVKKAVEALVRVPCALCPGGYYTMPAPVKSDQTVEGGADAGRRLRLFRGRR